MLPLGDLPGSGFASYAYAANGDGSVIVGRGVAARGVEAFYWSKSLGMVNLQDHLISLGASIPDGWILSEAHAVSADGLVIAGWGYHGGFREGWVATLPEPTSVALLSAAGLIIVGRRHFHRA